MGLLQTRALKAGPERRGEPVMPLLPIRWVCNRRSLLASVWETCGEGILKLMDDLE